MATNTTKLALRKPDTTDLVNVLTDLNDNYDKIDKLSKGELTCKTISGVVGPFTAATDIMVADPITAATNQRLLLMFDMLVQSTVANDIVTVSIMEGAVSYKSFLFECTRANLPYPAQGFVRLSPGAVGARTFKVSALRSTGTGNITVPVSATSAGQLLVTDLGQA